MKRAVLGLVLGLLLSTGTGQAAGATTFGSNLGGVSSSYPGAASTVANQTLAAVHVLPAGALVPSNGVIVRWRIKVGAEPSGQTAALRVIRNNVGSGRGATEAVPTAAGTYEYTTRLPAKPGDQIGIDATDNLMFGTSGASGDTWEFWQPVLPEGGAGTSPTALNLTANMWQVNADLEPDADGDGYGDETQDLCPTDASTHDACPDKTPPETTITVQPKAKSTAKQARLEFTSSEPGSTFECELDGSVFAGCTSPKIFNAGVGSHVFQVRAIDAAGNVDQSPATAEWKVKKHKRHHHHGHGHG